MSYADLLQRAKEQLPEDVAETSRFVIPKVKGHIQGQKTVINNLIQIANYMQRKPQHLLKFLQKELATPGEIIKQSFLFGSKLPAAKINEKIQKYSEIFVICPACGKPETKLSKEANVILMRCNACGSRNPVKSTI